MRAKTMGHTTTKQTYPFSTKKKKKKPILWSLSHRPTTNMSRAEGPKAPKPKTKKQREGKAKRERKKKRNPLGDSDFRFRTEASERRGRESESLRDVPAARRRRRSSCRGSVCDGKVRAEWRL